MATGNAPILSTPAEHILEDTTAAVVPTLESRLSEEQLYVQYEIKRTIDEIRDGKWRRIALQFPDEMLVDAPRVFEVLRDGLKESRRIEPGKWEKSQQNGETAVDDVAEGLEKTKVVQTDASDDIEERLCILADTSYGACCVDEVAAEHVDADVVVHYGRSCLSPTARLPVIYVFTTKPLDLDLAVESFKQTYPSKDGKICLMADIPYSHHLNDLQFRLAQEGYAHIFKTNIVRDPSSLIPNRTVPSAAQEDPSALKDYSIFHISTPPTSLLLTLSSRIKSMHIFPTDTATPTTLESSTAALLRRRYALITRLSTVPIFGILINTLSVSNYTLALTHCQNLLRAAGKKSYTFVVGKVNPAKIANFDEVGGWVVIGCWESSLIESKEFLRPIITPFELEVALMGDEKRQWGGEWIADFSQLLGRSKEGNEEGEQQQQQQHENDVNAGGDGGNWDDQSDDEPPEFDLRTGKYVSHSRPMGRPTRNGVNGKQSGSTAAPPSSALIQRAKGDVATIGGQISPAAEFLRSKRTWQGLGSDYEVAYERDEDGRIRGAAMEEGRSGVAKGYTVGEDETKS